MSYQLSFQNFPKPNTDFITLDKVLEKMDYLENIEFINKIRSNISNKTIRLAKDLAKQTAPLMFDYHDTVRSILQTNIDDKRIDKVQTFKQILFKTVIVNVKYHNGRYIIKTKKVKRR